MKSWNITESGTLKLTCIEDNIEGKPKYEIEVNLSIEQKIQISRSLIEFHRVLCESREKNFNSIGDKFPADKQ